jgi:hypothetical protein
VRKTWPDRSAALQNQSARRAPRASHQRQANPRTGSQVEASRSLGRAALPIIGVGLVLALSVLLFLSKKAPDAPDFSTESSSPGEPELPAAEGPPADELSVLDSEGTAASDSIAHTRKVVARGVVRNGDGEPLSGARVVWYDEGAEVLNHRFDRRVAFPELETGIPEWFPDGETEAEAETETETETETELRRAKFATAETDAEGRYEIGILAPEPRGILLAYSDGYGVEYAQRIDGPGGERWVSSSDSDDDESPGEDSAIADGSSAESRDPAADPGRGSDLGSEPRSLSADFTLNLAARVSGRVLVSESGAPATGMRVQADHHNEWLGKHFATVDESGHYAIIGIPPGIYSVYPASEGGELLSLPASARRRVDFARTTQIEGMDFEVQRGGAIHVTVVDEDGTPIEEADVTLDGESAFVSYLWECGHSSSEWNIATASDGRGTIRGIPLGIPVRVVATTTEAPVAVSEFIRLTQENPSANLRVSTVKTFSIAGRVSSELGVPARGALVECVPDELSESQVYEILEFDRCPDTFAQEEGAFEFTELPRGRYRLRTRASLATPFDRQEPAVEVTISDADVSGIALTVRGWRVEQEVEDPPIPTGSVTGLVVDEHDRAVSGARMSAEPYPIDPDTGFTSGEEIETDADGRFEISGLGGSEVELEAWIGNGDEWRSSVTHVPIGTRDVVLRLARDGIIRGRVVDARGEPVDRAKLQWFPPPSEEFGDIAWSLVVGGEQDTVSADDGRFELEMSGEARIVAIADGYAPTFSGAISVERGEVLDGMELVLSSGGSISGVVVSSDGQPVAEADVEVWFTGIEGRTVSDDERDEHFERSYLPLAVSQTNGAFELPHLSPGSYWLRASRARWTRSEIVEVIVREGARARSSPLVLRDVATIRGRVLEGEVPARGVDVVVEVPGWRSFQTFVGPGGTFEFSSVPPGQHRVVATDLIAVARAVGRRLVRHVTVESGAVHEVDFVFGKGFRVRGRVDTTGIESGEQILLVERDRASSDLVSKTREELERLAERHLAPATRGECDIQSDGTFELLDVEPGDYELVVAREKRAPGASPSTWTLHSQPIRVIDGDVDVAIELEEE